MVNFLFFISTVGFMFWLGETINTSLILGAFIYSLKFNSTVLFFMLRELFYGKTDVTSGGVVSFSPPSNVCIDAHEAKNKRANKVFFIYRVKCTISTEISAGLTPLILEAWPIFVGFILLSLSIASKDNDLTFE